MAKAKKRVATRKKSSKRGKASAKHARRKAHDAKTGKVQGQGRPETHVQETAAIEDRDKEGTK